MCLRIKCKSKSGLEKAQIPKKATKDIEVYKLLGKRGRGFIGRYRNFRYHRGQHYYQIGKHPFSFTTEEYWNKKALQIHQGLHSCKTLRQARTHASYEGNTVVVTMIIPKGAVFYENAQEYCSDQLVFPHEGKEILVSRKRF